MKEVALDAMEKAIEAARQGKLTNELIMRVVIHCIKLLEE